MTEQPSEQELLIRASNGDPDSFMKLCEAYMPQVHALCRGMVPGHSRVDSADLVDGVWFEVFTRVRNGKFDPNLGSFQAWLHVVARRVVMDMVGRDRKRKKIREAQEQLDDAAPEKLERTETWEAIQQALAELTPRESTVVRLFIDGVSTSEIAKQLSLSTTSVRKIKHRALKSVRAKLTSMGFGPEAISNPPVKQELPPEAGHKKILPLKGEADPVIPLREKAEEIPDEPLPLTTAKQKASDHAQDRLVLRACISEFAPEDEVVEELVNLYRTLNAYHIACGGSGLVIDDWQSFVRGLQEAGVF